MNFVATDVTSWPSQVKAFKSAISNSVQNKIDIVFGVAGVAGAPLILPHEEAAPLERDLPKPLNAARMLEADLKR